MLPDKDLGGLTSKLLGGHVPSGLLDIEWQYLAATETSVHVTKQVYRGECFINLTSAMKSDTKSPLPPPPPNKEVCFFFNIIIIY